MNRWNLEKLEEEEVKKIFEEDIARGLSKKDMVENVEEEWENVKKEILKSAEANLGGIKRTGRKPWVSDDILQLMDERRKYKNASDEESKRNYRQLRNAINRKCKLAKEEWIKEKCSEVEREMNIGKIDGAYRKVKENFGGHKLKSNNVLNKDGIPIYNTKGKADR